MSPSPTPTAAESRLAALRLRLRAAVLIGSRETVLRECIDELRLLMRAGQRPA